MTHYEMLTRKIDCALRPIETWPGSLTGWREPSRFRADWPNTLKLLARELDLIDAKSRVVQIALGRGMFRQDGFPRADVRRHDHPGVILSFTKGKRALSFPADRYDDWKDNIRAIALSLEALRAVDRYGVNPNDEQYVGWTAIEAPKPERTEFASPGEAAQWLAGESEWVRTYMEILANDRHFAEAYRRAAIRLHPDTGGSHEAFTKLQEAKRLLDEHHRRSA